MQAPGQVDGVRGCRTQTGGEGMEEEGLEDSGAPGTPGVSEELLFPPRTAWPWPPSSCRPVYSRPSRLPWPPRPPQTAPCSCLSSETAVSSAATATPPALEPLGLARGAAWPPPSSLREPVRACTRPPYHAAREPSPAPPPPPPPRPAGGGRGRWPCTISSGGAGQGCPVKE